MSKARLCSRQTCTREAIYTLTYAYSESAAVIGALSEHREPHAYDLCEFHADRLTAPQGWTVKRVDTVPEFGTSDRGKDAADHQGATYPPLRSVD